jgi:hypothetical protein
MPKATDQLEISGPLHKARFAREFPEFLDPLAHQIDNVLMPIGTDFERDREKVQHDRDRSPEWKVKAIVEKVRLPYAGKLDAYEKGQIATWRRLAAEGEAKIRLKGRIQRPTDPQELADYRERMREIRAEVKALPAIEREALYRNSGDPQVLDAIESAGPVLVRPSPNHAANLEPFVPPAVVGAGQWKRGEATDPATARQVLGWTALADVLESEVNAIRRVIEDGLPPAPLTVEGAA